MPFFRCHLPTLALLIARFSLMVPNRQHLMAATGGLHWEKDKSNVMILARLYVTKVSFKWACELSPMIAFFPSFLHSLGKAILIKPSTFPANVYLFKNNNRNIIKRCEICSKLTSF